MKVLKTLSLISLLFLVFLCWTCKKEESKNQLIGTWLQIAPNGIFVDTISDTFTGDLKLSVTYATYSDGYRHFKVEDYTYSFTDKIIITTYPSFGTFPSYIDTSNYSISGNKLMLWGKDESNKLVLVKK